jgi:hypothetical protein
MYIDTVTFLGCGSGPGKSRGWVHSADFGTTLSPSITSYYLVKEEIIM